MANKEVHEIIKWAEGLANQYDINISSIVNRFVEARKNLGDVYRAKEFIENEMKSLRGRNDG